jgi:hypothetical protein
MTPCQQPHWTDVGQGLPKDSITTDVSYCPAEDCLYILNGCHGCRTIVSFDGDSMGVYRRPRTGAWPHWARDRSFPLRSKRQEVALQLLADPNTGELLACTIQGLYRKTSGGWRQETTLGPVMEAACERGGQRRIMVRTADGLHLGNRGSWPAIAPTPWNKHATIAGFCFSQNALWVATNDGLFVSRDGSAHWQQCVPGAS